MIRFGLLPALLAAWIAPVVQPAEEVPPPLTSRDVAAIADMFSHAAEQGLPPIDASAAAKAASSADPAIREAADETLSAAAVAFARAEHGVLADPKSIDRNFALKSPYDAAADFAAARAAGHVPDWAASQLRRDPAFLALVRMRQAYAAIMAAGGWPTVPAGKALKPGSADPRTPVLRQRLAVEGYAAAAGAQPGLFDPALAAALSAFQADHGLKNDGVLTPETTDALNMTAGARLAAIDANLERARWLPAQMPADRIEVDAGDPSAVLFRAGAAVLTMRAIVGQPTKRTPTFASKVAAIEFNPPWIVPADIAARELFPKQRRSPGYFARNDFYVANGQVIQRAGPKSALGYVKFDIPDPFQVYLHDTPARTLFTRAKRWLSHGCIRLENPRDLAAMVLAPQGWNRAAIDAAVASGRTFSVAVKAPPPVFVLYRTVVAGADGHAVFRPDAYGWDAEIAAAMTATRP